MHKNYKYRKTSKVIYNSSYLADSNTNNHYGELMRKKQKILGNKSIKEHALTKSKKLINTKKLIKSSHAHGKTKKLETRSVRHYQPETVNIIKTSLKIISPRIHESESVKQEDKDYVSAVSAIKTSLAKLASTLTDILTEDPDEHDKTNHRDLLANFFQMPGTDNNGIHLVATSNIEALSNDLNLHKNTREYNWLMNNGVNVLEYEILAKLNTEMTQLENGKTSALDHQHERAIELHEISYKTIL